MKKYLYLLTFSIFIFSGCRTVDSITMPTTANAIITIENTTQSTEIETDVSFDVATDVETMINTTTFSSVSPYNPDYICVEWKSCVGEGVLYRDLPTKIELADGTMMSLIYDESFCLREISIDEQLVYSFEWESDPYYGVYHLRRAFHNGITLDYADILITRNSWQEEIFYQPYTFSCVASGEEFLFHLTAGMENFIDGIFLGNERIAKIEYEDNLPVVSFMEDGLKLSDKEKTVLVSNCRFIDGVVYIEELQAYYSPNRYFVDAKSGSALGSLEEFAEECYSPVVLVGKLEKEDGIWANQSFASTEPFLLSKKLSDGRELELVYGQVPTGEYILIQKNIDGECVTTYRWKNNQYGAGFRIYETVTNGNKVEYIYSQRASGKYMLYDLYGFRYGNKTYRHYYWDGQDNIDQNEEDGPFLSIFYQNEEIVCYDAKKNVLRGAPFPGDVDILFGNTEKNMKNGYIYIDEARDFYRACGLQ